MDQYNRENNKTAGLFDWDDVGVYVQNLINNVERGFPLSKEEEDVIKELPQEVLDDALDEAVSTEPLDTTPKVKRVKKKKPKEAPLAPEEKEELIEESPELQVLNTFFPEIMDDDMFIKEAPTEAYIDASYTVLEYLRAFGYRKGMWVIGPEHKALLVPVNERKNHCRPMVINGIPASNYDPSATPICDYLHGQDISIDDLVVKAQSHASDKSYYPPRSILAQTHPHCQCYVLCWAPERAENIPDSAPGVPTFGTKEEKLYYKNQIFARLQNFPVDRYTFLNPVIYEATETSEGRVIDEHDLVYSEHEYGGEAVLDDLYSRQRKSSSNWKEDIRPVGISNGYVFKHSLGFVRPVPITYRGFQVTTNGEHSRVFLGDLNRYVYASVGSIQPLKLKPSAKELYGKDYVKVDDTLGVALSNGPNGTILCYLPEFGEVAAVDSAKVYEVS